MPTIWLLVVMITHSSQGGLDVTRIESEQDCLAAQVAVVGWASEQQASVVVDCLPIKSSGQDAPAPEQP